MNKTLEQIAQEAVEKRYPVNSRAPIDAAIRINTQREMLRPIILTALTKLQQEHDQENTRKAIELQCMMEERDNALTELAKARQEHETQVAALVQEKCQLATALEAAREDGKRLIESLESIQEMAEDSMYGDYQARRIMSTRAREAITQAIKGAE